MRITDTHIYFWDGVFSNWYPCIIKLPQDGNVFNCSEQMFMFAKAKYFGDEKIAQEILKAKHPKEQKNLGRKIENFDESEWAKVRVGFMHESVIRKFTIPGLRKQLMDTGDKIIVEASPYDTIWGVGLSENDDKILSEMNWKGQNLLGKVLMNVRENPDFANFGKNIEV